MFIVPLEVLSVKFFSAINDENHINHLLRRINFVVGLLEYSTAIAKGVGRWREIIFEQGL